MAAAVINSINEVIFSITIKLQTLVIQNDLNRIDFQMPSNSTAIRHKLRIAGYIIYDLTFRIMFSKVWLLETGSQESFSFDVKLQTNLW